MKKKNIILAVIACTLLILAAVYQQAVNKQDILHVLQKAEPAAADYKELKGSFQTYELIDKNGEFLSYAVISSASGYGGPILMLTTVSGEGAVINTVILEHAETPAYLERVVKAGYPENLQGAAVTDTLKEDLDLDAVAGATMTTDGIIAAVEKGMYSVGENQLGLDVPPVQAYQFQWEHGAAALILAGAGLAAVLKLKRLRVLLLILSVIIIGFMANFSLTLGNFLSVFAGKLPSINERPFWYIFVIAIPVFILFIGKNIYCGWLCPFGAVQEGIYKALHLTKNRLDQRLVTFAGKSRWLYIWLAALLALLFNNPGMAGYEPFAVFFGGEGPVSQWIIMGLILIMSIFIFRFWCRCFCPVGAVLDFIAIIKRRVKRLFQKKLPPEAQLVQKSILQLSESSCGTCQSGCNRDKIKEAKLSAFNKFTVFIIILVDLLIIGVLLQNIGLFY